MSACVSCYFFFRRWKTSESYFVAKAWGTCCCLLSCIGTGVHARSVHTCAGGWCGRWQAAGTCITEGAGGGAVDG